MTVALIMGGLVLVGGVTTGAPLEEAAAHLGAAQGRAGRQGRAAPDVRPGELQGRHGRRRSAASKTTFAGGEADLTLAEPLHVGDNELALQIDRPGLGRDEAVKLVVPVAFRVHADIATMSAPRARPSPIRAEALPGQRRATSTASPSRSTRTATGAYAIDEIRGDRGAGRRVADHRGGRALRRRAARAATRRTAP